MVIVVFCLDTFYRSKEWRKFRQIVIQERTKDDGFVYDEETGEPILKGYDIILHHKIYLTEENVNDTNISLNPDNIEIVSHRTHNKIHNKGWGKSHGSFKRQEVFLVYGSPLSGKTSWVEANKSEGDLVIDIDNIWQCITGEARYQKPNTLKRVAFKMRDNLLECVKYRVGWWQNAYIIGGYPLSSERERIYKEYGARPVFVDTSKDECLKRLEYTMDGRYQGEWTQYIERWWERYTPDDA